jgi:hypothetical protein
MDSVFNRKIDPLKKHGIGDVGVNDSHRWFLQFLGLQIYIMQPSKTQFLLYPDS